jgi:hypothetical protein
MAAAIETATGHAGPSLIEVEIDPTDCGLTMREWITRVALAKSQAARP